VCFLSNKQHRHVRCDFSPNANTAATIDAGGNVEGESILIEVRPDWAPLASKRFIDLVRDGYFST
jgi:hypothetical protein